MHSVKNLQFHHIGFHSLQVAGKIRPQILMSVLAAFVLLPEHSRVFHWFSGEARLSQSIMDQATKSAVLEMFQQSVNGPSSSLSHNSSSAPTTASDLPVRSPRIGDLDTEDGHESEGNSSVLDAAPSLATYTAEDYLSTKHSPAKKILKVYIIIM